MWNLLKIVVKSSQFIHLFDISDLIPLDLLSFVLEKDPSKLAPNVHVKQARGVSGVHFSGPHTSMTFPSSSQLLVNCELFPQNISIVLTLKIDSGAAKVSILEVRLHVKFTVRSALNIDPGSILRLWGGFRALTGNKSVNQYGISTLIFLDPQSVSNRNNRPEITLFDRSKVANLGVICVGHQLSNYEGNCTNFLFVVFPSKHINSSRNCTLLTQSWLDLESVRWP